ncbi:MAG: hypothetical protein EA405_08305 [Rhodospirillales bacterium]|nr:MAG: hypothetical protein EA405_08305 [Rhodospirillales bacterium]
MDLLRHFRPSPFEIAARQLYIAAVEQARNPLFYQSCGVPDTPDGRFDMIVIHVVLLLRRMKQDREATSALSQALFDLMFADMDQNLREMGVGDVSVGPRIKAMAKNFYGRLAAYDQALAADAPEGALEAALRRNLYRKSAPSIDLVAAVADYMRREAEALAAVATDDLCRAAVRFGTPPAVS